MSEGNFVLVTRTVHFRAVLTLAKGADRVASQIPNVLMILFDADRSVTIIIIKHLYVHIFRPVDISFLW